MKNFTNWEKDKEANYGGSDHKWGIKDQDGNRYMVKTADKISEDKRNELNSSYSNSVLSEYICCHIVELLGYKVQETMLGKYTFNNSEEKDIVVCKNFIEDENKYKLIEFKDIENSLLDRKPPKVPHIEDIYEILGKDNPYFTLEMSKKALERYWDIFIVDSLIANFDRHANNWGYILDKKQDKIIDFAPVYDCGSCLYPQLSDKVIEDILASPEEIDKRIFKFPNAALIIEGKKTNYYEYINSLCNEDTTNALLRVYPKINLDKINAFIDNLEELSDIRKLFYKTMLQQRYDKILTPAYQKVMKQQMQGTDIEKKEELKNEQQLNNSVVDIKDSIMEEEYEITL